MSKKSNTVEGGTTFFISLVNFLTLVFIILKLLGKINWSWWKVLSPLWLPPVLMLGIAFVFIGLFILRAVRLNIWQTHKSNKDNKSNKFLRNNLKGDQDGKG